MPRAKEISKGKKKENDKRRKPLQNDARKALQHQHLQSRTLATNLLRAERREVLVERVNGTTALDKLDHTPNIAVGPDDNYAAILFAQTHLDVSGCLGLGHTNVKDVVGVHVIVVAGQELGQQLADLDVGPVGVEDGGEGEEVRVRVVLFQVVDGGDVGALVGGEERVLLGQVRGEIGDCFARPRGLATEDVNAVGTVERDLLLEVNGVRVGDAGDGGGDEDAAGTELGGACGLGEEERVLGRVCVGPVEVVGAVGNAVAGSEFAGCFEGLDELVLLGWLLLAGSVLVDAADFASTGLALGEELCVCCVKVE